MYYICAKRDDYFGATYGVMDTEDGVVEFYSYRKIIKFVKDLGVHIKGVSYNNSKWNIKVLSQVDLEKCRTSKVTKTQSCNEFNCVKYNSFDFDNFKTLISDIKRLVNPILLKDASLYARSIDEILIQSDIKYTDSFVCNGDIIYSEQPKFLFRYKESYNLSATIAECTHNGKYYNLRFTYNQCNDFIRLYSEGICFIHYMNKATLFEGNLQSFKKFLDGLFWEVDEEE